jgi:hypothetical protein
VIGAVFEAQGLDLGFGDSPAQSSIKFDAHPDAIIENLQAPGRPLVVGEFKTPWTRHLDTMSDVQLALLLGIQFFSNTKVPMLINKLGQVARYMDDYGCVDEFLSTYDQTVFIGRTGPFKFKRSPIILHTASSSAQPRAVSVRECMVYLARHARGRRIGRNLVSDALFHCCILTLVSRRTGLGGHHTIFEIASQALSHIGVSFLEICTKYLNNSETWEHAEH